MIHEQWPTPDLKRYCPMEEKNAYQKKLQAKLDEWQADIDKMMAKAKQASADSQIKYEKQIEELRARRDEMAEQLEKLQKSQSAAWLDMKAGAEKAWDDMNTAMRKAWDRFG